MILGVDHIALSCENVVYGAKLLGEVGYRVKFVEEGVPNHRAKRPFLMSYEPFHSVAYCQAEQNVSVELTQHSSPLRDAVSPYQVLTNGLLTDAIPFVGKPSIPWQGVWRATVGCRQPVAALWRPFHAQFWYDAQRNEPSPGLVWALLVPVTDLSLSERFWVKGLGCRVVNRGLSEDGRSWVHVAFRAPVPTWSLDVILAKSEGIDTLPHVDEPGFPCLAVISNRLTKDKDAMLKVGAGKVSDEFILKMGGKSLKIVMLRGPDGEVVEMIEFHEGREV